jgi:DUF1680 family protein
VFPHPEQTSEIRRTSRPVAHTAIHLEDSFWASRQQALREVTLPHIYEQLKQYGHFEHQWHPDQGPIPYVFWETDITKWLEAASYSLATHPDPALDGLLDEAIAYLASFQQPDGYLNIWFTAIEPEQRWTNLRDLHELYCAGHLIEAAVAHFQATGKRSLLDIVCRYADYIDTVFGPEEGKRRGYCGHEEIELALIKLYRATSEERYLRLSRYFVDERGQQPFYFDDEARARGEDPENYWAKTYEYCQAHVPIAEQHEVVGHAVRAMYLYCALADLAQEQNDEALLHHCERFWQHLSTRRLYLTGGLGSSAENEGLTADYDLPNASAYAETCAGIGLMLWSHRMLQLDVDRRYTDILERTLYNGILSGISLDGKGFFYVNPLESRGEHHRHGWFKCACCPPNLARIVASLGQYIYGIQETDLFVHLYLQNRATIEIGGQQIVLHQETNYPWDGSIRLSLQVAQSAQFALNLRIPGWSSDTEAQIQVNGEEVPVAANLYKGYLRIERRWQTGDVVQLDLAMPIQQIWAHPDVRADNGSVALQRGPLVYCLEGADSSVPLHRISLPANAKLESHFEPTLLGGVTVIRGQANIQEVEDWNNTLYRTTTPVQHPHPLVAIPYYAWDNREPGEMRVWIHAEQ